MFPYKIITKYLFHSYCVSFLTTVFIFAGIFILSNTFDTLSKFKTIEIPMHVLWRLVLYKVPYLINEVSIILGSIATLVFWIKIIKRKELIAILCSGISIFNIMIISLFATGITGIVMIIIIDPIGVLGLNRYQKLETKLLKKQRNNLVVSNTGLFVSEKYNNEKRVIHIKSINSHTQEMKNLILLFFDHENHLIKRIDADNGKIINSELQLTNIKVIDSKSIYQDNIIVIPTHLAINNLISSFSAPKMFSIWELPNIISYLKQFGLSAIEYQVHYYKQLFKPLIMLATAMLSCIAVIFKINNKNYKIIFINGTVISFLGYILIEIAIKVLINNEFSVFSAVMLPICILILIANFIFYYYIKFKLSI